MTETQPDNPFLSPWTGPFEAPPFALIGAAHFRPAFDAALEQARSKVAAVAANPEPATFENTVKALERSGRMLSRVSSVFFNLASADSNDEIQAIEREIAPRLARHGNDIFLNRALYDRVDALQAKRESLGLDVEQARVLERYHVAFSRAGAGLAAVVRRAAVASNRRGRDHAFREGSRRRPGYRGQSTGFRLRASVRWRRKAACVWHAGARL